MVTELCTEQWLPWSKLTRSGSLTLVRWGHQFDAVCLSRSCFPGAYYVQGTLGQASEVIHTRRFLLIELAGGSEHDGKEKCCRGDPLSSSRSISIVFQTFEYHSDLFILKSFILKDFNCRRLSLCRTKNSNTVQIEMALLTSPRAAFPPVPHVLDVSLLQHTWFKWMGLLSGTCWAC